MMKSKYDHLKIIYNRSKLGWYWAPLYIILWFLLFYFIVLHSFHYYPNILKIQDEYANPGSFIGERAEQILLKLTKIGPKVVGSPANEQGALHLLLYEIGSIKEEARKDLYDIEHEVQVASGNYAEEKYTNSYQSIQNVVVRVSPKNLKNNCSLLVNSHFDSANGSPGAGDAGLMIAVMLETLRVITKYETPINYTIIFLFNGAEEMMLQGSHAFITQHKWAKNISAVINLDSCGSGGREMLFRTGPASWLMKYYASHAIHPFSTVFGEEFFELKLIPSETDFKAFRRFGISGLDMASILNGYVYHTKYDRFSAVPRGSYQSTGDNVLALTKALASAPEMEDPKKQSEEKLVFFDVLGWFFVCYTATTGLILNIVIVVIAILTILAFIWNMANQTGMFRKRIFAKFCILLGIQFAAISLAILITMSLAFLIDAVGLPLSWYSQKWMIFGLYFCPMFFMLGILPAIYLGIVKEHGLPLGYAIQLIMHSHCLMLCVLSIVLTAFGVRSAFLLSISIGFYTISVLLNIITCFHDKTFHWLIPHIVCQILPFLFYTYYSYMFLEVFVPIAGRTGVHLNTEIIIAACAAGTSVLFAAFLIPIFWLFRKSKLIISTFAFIFVVFIILALTSVGFPYMAKESPKRFIVEHTTRTYHNADPQMTINRTESGFIIKSEDRRTNVLDFLSNYTIDHHNDHCGSSEYNGLSSSETNMVLFISDEGPEPHGWPTIRILSKQSTSVKNVLYTIEISGPDLINIHICPVNNAKLIDWSFDQSAIKRNEHTNETILLYRYALDPAPLIFNLEFEHVNANWSGPAFDLVVKGNKLHHDIFFTEKFRNFLANFPPWTVVNAWISFYEHWRL